MESPIVIAIIPAFNEEKSLPLVLVDIPAHVVDRVVVVDNASTDRTAEVAREFGAIVVQEPRRGYGSACLAGIARARELGADIYLFLDADYSDHPGESEFIVREITENGATLAIGSRTRGRREPGAMPPQAIFGNWLATRLIRVLWGVRYTDLGPFRAITAEGLDRIGMVDTTFGWTVEMQAKGAKLGMKSAEVPVSYRRRIGQSKISGTLQGSIRAGYKILLTIARVALTPRQRIGRPRDPESHSRK